MRDAIRRLLGRAPADAGAAIGASGLRWIVVDVETTGLDQAADALLAIGAVAVHGERIAVGDSFEILVRPDRPSSRDNILIHGIGGEAQQGGVDPATACTQFLEFVGDAPLVAFHAPFDRAFLARAVRTHLRRSLRNQWFDLAELAPALYPKVKASGLDEWLRHFHIDVRQRHHASSDAFATAMLFVRLLAALPPQQRTPHAVRKLASHAKWLTR